MAQPGATHPDQASFDLTPMIDVILLLIIFFMLTSQFAQTQLRPMDLPKEAGPDVAGKASAAVVIDMDREGHLSAFGTPLTMEELAGIVPVGGGAEDPASRASVIIRADRTAPAAHLNRLAERLVSLGVREWRLATNPEGRAPVSGAPRAQPMKLARVTTRLDPAGLRLPLIALIDVMLFLLIYFMVAGSLAAEEGRLAAALRGTGGRGPITSDLQPQVLNVETADGHAVFRLGDRVFEARAALYQALLQLPAEVGITIRVNDAAPIAAVATATQLCRDAGFQKLSYLPAKAPPAPTPPAGG